MSERPKLASIECEQCSALLEIYPLSGPGKATLEWITRDEDMCKAPPVNRCPHAHTEVEKRFPGFEG